MRIVNGSNEAAGAAQAPPRRALDRAEWDLVWALREVPPGELKRSMVALLREIVAFVGHPTCAESQADGVPCSSVSRECTQCQRVDALLGLLHDSLQSR
jgi:hypothetical protein